MTARVSNIPANDDDVLVNVLRSAFDMSGGDPSEIFDALAVAVDHEIWVSRGMTFVQLVQSPYPKGLGLTPKKLDALLKLEHRYEANNADIRERMTWLRRAVVDLLNAPVAAHGENQYSPKSGADIISSTQFGTDPDYAIRRLKRDRPDLAERVLLGELSPHQAAIQAGFRKRTLSIPIDDPDRIAATLRRHLTAEQLAALKEAL